MLTKEGLIRFCLCSRTIWHFKDLFFSPAFSLFPCNITHHMISLSISTVSFIDIKRRNYVLSCRWRCMPTTNWKQNYDFNSTTVGFFLDFFLGNQVCKIEISLWFRFIAQTWWNLFCILSPAPLSLFSVIECSRETCRFGCQVLPHAFHI